MATILEQYLAKKEEQASQIKSGSLPMEALTEVQEVSYRLDVLEAFKAFCQTAPITTDTKVLSYHYQVVNAYIGFLCAERKFGPKTNEEGQKKREAAAVALDRVVQDGRKRFASFKADKQDQYKTCINSLINTVVPIWIQYRNTYINI